jgi:hypothetical protein
MAAHFSSLQSIAVVVRDVAVMVYVRSAVIFGTVVRRRASRAEEQFLSIYVSFAQRGYVEPIVIGRMRATRSGSGAHTTSLTPAPAAGVPPRSLDVLPRNPTDDTRPHGSEPRILGLHL